MTARTTALALIVLDVAASIVVFNLIGYARGVILPGSWLIGPLLIPTGAFIISVYLVQGYRARTDMLSVDYASQHAIATLGAMTATLLLTYVFPFMPAGYELQSSRFVILLSFITVIPLTLGYRRLFYLRAAASHLGRNIVFVGDAESCTTFLHDCQMMEMPQRVIFCTVNEGAYTDEAPGNLEVQLFRNVLQKVQTGDVQIEAIVLRESAHELPADIARHLVQLYFSGVPTYTLELFHQVYWQKIPLYRLNQTWLFQEGFQIAREPVFERAKRVSDVVLALVGLALACPLMALAAIAVWIEDRGPMFFAQTRIGLNHVPFRLLKLRTMKIGAESGARYTQPGDSRITRVGRILRATRIDEFPQLWNVLRGQMSLIGPRAEWDQLVHEYESVIPCYHFRHLVKPGITGWAQVNYPYGASVADTLRKLEYDLYYIRHFSFRLDATIVLKTIHIMLFGKGR